MLIQMIRILGDASWTIKTNYSGAITEGQQTKISLHLCASVSEM